MHAPVESSLPKMLWTYAVMTAAVTRNSCNNSRIHQNPYYALTGRKPYLSKMRVFGSACYAYKRDKKKLDARCEKGIFEWYDKNSPAYLVYYPATGKVLKHRVAKFITRCVTEHKTLTDISMSNDGSHGERYVSSQSKQNIADQASENTHEPQTETENQSSAQTEGGDQSMRYPKRNRRAPQYLTDYVSAVECDD